MYTAIIKAFDIYTKVVLDISEENNVKVFLHFSKGGIDKFFLWSNDINVINVDNQIVR
jgi:small nuclear ribonucleoprotein (snRNP)-like protein